MLSPVFNKYGVNPHKTIATAIAINPVKKDPPANVTRFPIIIGEIIPPINAPILITAKDEPIIADGIS